MLRWAEVGDTKGAKRILDVVAVVHGHRLHLVVLLNLRYTAG